MKSIFIMSWEQFGYHTDNYMYCKYLSLKYRVTIISYYEGLEKVKPFDNTEVIYINKGKNNKINRIKYVLNSIRLIKINKYDSIFIRYFKGCSLIKPLIGCENIIVDIRTASVEKDINQRHQYDEKLREECCKFDKISIISEGLRDKLKLPKEKTYILPLGADTIIDYKYQKEPFNKSEMKLLYIGTFYNREIQNTVKAFVKFYENHKNDNKNIKFTIAGFSPNPDEVKLIVDTIEKNNMQKQIDYIGRVKYSEIKKLLETHNFGLSYIPVNEYYDNQPPTKTYEYILNGLYCIATNTNENIKVITYDNGVISTDTEDGLKNALEKAYLNLNKYNKENIINSLSKYTWSSIINKHLIKILDS